MNKKFDGSLKKICPWKGCFDLLSDQVVITDSEGRIVYANLAAVHNTGFTLTEMLSKKPGDLWGGHMDKEFYVQMWQIIKEDKKIFVGEVKNVDKFGREYWQELRITPIFDAKNKIIFFIAIEPVITSRKISEKLRNEFNSIVGHQLLSPWTTNRYLMEIILGEGGLKGKYREIMVDIYNRNKLGINLIIDILLLSRLEGVPPPKENFDLIQLINEILEGKKREYRQIEFLFKAVEPPPNLFVNKQLASQLFGNIISNAAEYSPAQGSQVSIEIKRDGSFIVFSCADNGIGIPEDDKSKIFDRFFRAGNVARVKKQGTGLGLFIVKLISDKFGWQVNFESVVGKGTTFFVKIPS